MPSEEVKLAFERFKHMDSVLSDENWARVDLAQWTAHLLWEVIKVEYFRDMPSASPRQEVPLETFSTPHPQKNVSTEIPDDAPSATPTPARAIAAIPADDPFLNQ